MLSNKCECVAGKTHSQNTFPKTYSDSQQVAAGHFAVKSKEKNLLSIHIHYHETKKKKKK